MSAYFSTNTSKPVLVMWPYVPHCSSPESCCFIAKCMDANKWARFSVCTGEKISTSEGNKRTRENDYDPSLLNTHAIQTFRSHKSSNGRNMLFAKFGICVLNLRPGQTETQVDASWKLAFTCVSVWPDLRALVLTCDDLRSLWSRSNLHANQRKFFTVWSPIASQRKFCCLLKILNWSARSSIKMAFWQLACTCE